MPPTPPGGLSPAPPSGSSAASDDAVLGRRLTWFLALTCGVTVANIYFPQALIPLIAASLRVSESTAALAATSAQLGYAAGMFLLVPLGDRMPHRRLIATLTALTGAGLLAAGLAPDAPVLIAAGALVGATTSVPQIILPMAAGLAGERRRGAVTGTLLSGLIGGILLARAFGGVAGAQLGWRAPYLIAAVVALLLAPVLAVVLPVTAPASRERYPRLLGEAVRLLREEPDLRRSCLYQAAMFGGFSAAWTAVALLISGPRYGLGAQAVGLVALVGAASMVCTPVVGRRVDRAGPDAVTPVCALAALAAAAVLAGGSAGGAAGMAALVAGMLLLDAAVQSGQVANQSRIFALRPEARARLNTAYMTCSFLGGSAGSWLGVRAYERFGWAGVCGLVAALAALVLARHILRRPSPSPASAAVPPGSPSAAGGTVSGAVEERAPSRGPLRRRR
ncbi:MFS transporter [Actinomadura nitritigenes]|uniref:MFS transporter n=1 Tax=Actinomadura nitritigenes TaxID=134602 RepID=UPI003D931DB0